MVKTRLTALLSWLRLDWHTAKLTVKTSIPPAVLVCAIQSDTWISYFGQNAYLAPIAAASVMAGFPQGMLFEFNAKQTLGYTVAYCWALLAGWCGLQARKHTTGSSGDLAAYNASAEAVVAILLAFGMWVAFTVKSAFPSWNIQTSVAAILGIAMIPALARLPTMDSIIKDATNAFVAFLAGQAIGLGNALLIFPQSCRGLFSRAAISCLDALEAIMRAHEMCIRDIVSGAIPSSSTEMTDNKSVEKLESALQQLGNEVAKANGHVDHAAREISWGAYTQSELDAVCALLVQLVPPVSGLSLVADMMQRETDVPGVVGHRKETATEDARHQTSQPQDDWHNAESEMQEHLCSMIEIISSGAEHAKLRLRHSQKRNWTGALGEKSADEEGQGVASPGGARFADSYRDMFKEDGDESLSRQQVLHRYVQHRPQVGEIESMSSDKHAETLRYFALLHSQTILVALGRKLLKLIIYLDERHARPKRLVTPNFLSFTYWSNLFSFDLAKAALGDTRKRDDGPKVELDPVFHKPRNPDHLPAANSMEAVGDCIRKINSVLRTEHAAYGLRGVCAVMTIAIIGFLRDSQDFYFAQRLLWALFAILLSMGRTSGSSTFLLMGRLLGTTASMVASYIIWYIVDQRTPGVLVFLWLWFLVISFLTVRFPAFFSIWFVALIAAIVMIGIELQTAQIGEEVVEKSGQAVYPPYVIFPYRLAIVALGVITGYIWTVFPYPISEHSELRESTAQVLYELSRYYMCIQQTVFARLHRDIGDADDASSPSSRLQSALRRLFLKYRGLSANAKRLSQFLNWEFSLGGRFPKAAYKEILSILDRSGSYMALTSYLSKESKSPGVIAACWAESGTGVPSIDLTPHGIASRIIILHSALGSGHPLPPGLHPLGMPHLLQISGDINSKDYDFAIAALIHNVHWYFIHDVNRLTELVREVVGELRFSFIDDLGGAAADLNAEPATPASASDTTRA